MGDGRALGGLGGEGVVSGYDQYTLYTCIQHSKNKNTLKRQAQLGSGVLHL